MNDDAPPPRLRGTPLVLARAGALTVSIGVLVFLMVRAGGGCRSADTSAVAEPRTAAPSAAAPAAAASTAQPAYFPGSKAWGGDGLRVGSAQPGASAAAPAAKPQYFPGSKSIGGDVVLDPPPAQLVPTAAPKPRFFPGSKSDPHVVHPGNE